MTVPDHEPGLTLQRVLPLISIESTNEEKIAALSVIPNLISPSDQPALLLQIHAALDYNFIQRLLTSKSSSNDTSTFPLIALNILSVLSSHPEIACSPTLTALVGPVLQLSASFASDRVLEDALELVYRLGYHGNRDLAVAVLAHPAPLLETLVRLNESDHGQAGFLNYILLLSKTAGPSLAASIPLLTLIKCRIQSQSSASIKDNATDGAVKAPLTPSSIQLVIKLFLEILESLPLGQDVDLGHLLPCSLLIEQLLRTRSTPKKLTRLVLRLASAYLVHAPTGLSDCPKTWLTVISAATVDLLLIMDTDYVDQISTATALRDGKLDRGLIDETEKQPTLESEIAVTTNCSIIEFQMAALVDQKISIPADFLLIWKRQASQLMLSVGGFLAPISVRWWDSPVILSLCRLACYILCESEELGVFPEIELEVHPMSAHTFSSGSSMSSETHVNVFLAPLIVHLVSDPSAPQHVLPWALAYIAHISADDNDSIGLESILNVRTLIRRSTEVLMNSQNSEDYIIVTHVSSTIINLVVLRHKKSNDHNVFLEMLAESITEIALAANSVLLPPSLKINNNTGPILSDSVVAQAFGTLCVCLAISLRAIMHHQTKTVLTSDTVTKIMQAATVFVCNTWYLHLEFHDLVHLALDPLIELCESNQSVGRMWHDLVSERKVLFHGIQVPSGFGKEAHFLGIISLIIPCA